MNSMNLYSTQYVQDNNGIWYVQGKWVYMNGNIALNTLYDLNWNVVQQTWFDMNGNILQFYNPYGIDYFP